MSEDAWDITTCWKSASWCPASVTTEFGFDPTPTEANTKLLSRNIRWKKMLPGQLSLTFPLLSPTASGLLVPQSRVPGTVQGILGTIVPYTGSAVCCCRGKLAIFFLVTEAHVGRAKKKKMLNSGGKKMGVNSPLNSRLHCCSTIL